MSEENKIPSLLKASATLLTLFAPVGYIIGLGYYEGLMVTYGVSSDLFPIPVQDIYEYAYYSVLLGIGSVISVIADSLSPLISNKYVGAIVIGALIGLVLIVCYWINSKYGDITKAAFVDEKELRLLWYVSMFVLIWTLPLLVSLKMGQESANDGIDKYLKSGCVITSDDKWSNCTKLVLASGKTLYEGLLVAASTNYVAFFTHEGAIITQIPAGAVLIHQRATASAEKSN